MLLLGDQTESFKYSKSHNYWIMKYLLKFSIVNIRIITRFLHSFHDLFWHKLLYDHETISFSLRGEDEEAE